MTNYSMNRVFKLEFFILKHQLFLQAFIFLIVRLAHFYCHLKFTVSNQEKVWVRLILYDNLATLRVLYGFELLDCCSN